MSEPVRNLLPEKRAEKGFTQFALALETRINPSQLGEYERGVRFPRPEAIDAIAAALGEKPATVYEWLTTPASAIAPEPAGDVETAEVSR